MPPRSATTYRNDSSFSSSYSAFSSRTSTWTTTRTIVIGDTHRDVVT